MNTTTHDGNGNIVEQTVDHGDGTGTRTVYDGKGNVTSTEQVDGLPIVDIDPEHASDDPLALKRFTDGNLVALADDHDDQLVFLARNAWHLGKAEEEFPEVRFLKTRESGG